jgi:hypothetical protein
VHLLYPSPPRKILSACSLRLLPLVPPCVPEGKRCHFFFEDMLSSDLLSEAHDNNLFIQYPLVVCCSCSDPSTYDIIAYTILSLFVSSRTGIFSARKPPYRPLHHHRDVASSSCYHHVAITSPPCHQYVVTMPPPCHHHASTILLVLSNITEQLTPYKASKPPRLSQRYYAPLISCRTSRKSLYPPGNYGAREWTLAY